MKNLLMLLLSIFFFSCQSKENKNTSVSGSDSIATNKDTLTTKMVTNTKQEINKQVGDTIFMDSKNEQGLFIADGLLDSIHPKVYVKFKNEDLGELNGNIIPAAGKGNIRFNQIIFPNKNSDGPFGMDLKIPLTQKGNHIIVIGHSQMADNPYWGKFKVQLENKKK
ncbi:hypothetical protein ASE40_07415 [Flavobacterium sp. Root935]|uniref:hypothetical protein n=1 Tax=Flavobacterium sp. Root935 TaxID=1736610 RepID=UPI00070ACA3E|nr:hypothetical protein [Flavobacterium sp. Root935]KRD61358.1 hypothetical protein ASE40_07415 [Flavobacterium sp. Root935]